MLILIVDDEKMQREMLQGFLEKQGYKVLTASGGNEALHIFETAPVQLVLLDHRMEDMNGDEVLEKMRRASPLVRAIMITAYGDVTTAVKVMQLGADDFMEKPVDLTELLEKIRRIEQSFAVQEESEKITESLERAELPLSIIGSSRPMQELLRLADYVFYQSKFCKQAADIHLGCRKDRFEILYNPVDTKRFLPAATRTEGRKLLLAGSHHQLYRVRTAVETIDRLREKIPDIHLTIAGKFCWQHDPAEAKGQLLSLIRDLDLTEKVSIEGAYSQQQVVALMQNHHVLLHTKYNDPCPRLVAEALACGLPVVYSSSGGVPELVGTEAGIGVTTPFDWEKLHPPSPEKLATAVVEIFSDYSRYASAARMQAEMALDVRPWRERHKEIFKTILQ